MPRTKQPFKKLTGNQDRLVFGTMLKASRLRYIYMRRRNCFVRFTPLENEIRCELAPNNVRCLQPSKKRGELHSWDTRLTEQDFMDASPCLRRIRSVKKPFTIYIDDNGELIRIES